MDKDFDSILCIGTVDWWYHNRGHFDLQILKYLQKKVPVLYINSIGMRLPKPGKGNFIGKLKRKFKSFCRGLKKVDENFWVYSPINIPSVFSGMPSSQSLLSFQIKWASRRLGFKKPLCWVGTPTGFPIVKNLDKSKMLYQCTDLYAAYDGVDNEVIRDLDYKLRTMSDVTIFCSSLLKETFGPDCAKAVFVDHGVDYNDFVTGASAAEPKDLSGIPHPRVGFVGGISNGVFDTQLFLDVARKAPEFNFVLVGNCDLPSDWCTLKNVHLLGKKNLSEVPAYMAYCDVLTVFFCNNDWTNACNPIKVKEYFAVGKPVVSTPIAELNNYPGLIMTAATSEEFIEYLRTYQNWFAGIESCRNTVINKTWKDQAELLWSSL